MIFKGYGILRSVTGRTWYKQSIWRIVIDIPYSEISNETLLKLKHYHWKKVYVKVKETDFEQKEVSDYDKDSGEEIQKKEETS